MCGVLIYIYVYIFIYDLPSGYLTKLWKTRFYFAGVSRIEEANHLYMDRFP